MTIDNNSSTQQNQSTKQQQEETTPTITQPDKEETAEKPNNNTQCSTRPRRRIIRRKNATTPKITIDPELEKLISASSLPVDYNFEIPKTIQRIQTSKSKHVALQLPEGLLMYSCTIADIITHTIPYDIQISILGDVTYGACCINDLGAQALECDLLVHYGHSCLIPVNKTVIPCLYVFVELRVDVRHVVDCVCATVEEGTSVHVMGTVQFRSAISDVAKELSLKNRSTTIPQCKPLSPGEVLGCTAPCIAQNDEDNNNAVILFIADGRFHLEAAMIANPKLPALRYDPYSKVLTWEKFDFHKMATLRSQAIQQASKAEKWGIILGTLGRQGNPSILQNVCKLLENKIFFIILLSEISPQKLELMKEVEAWVQIACPRLSMDWGHYFKVPVLNSFELNVCFSPNQHQLEESYPMDYYAKDVDGPWGNYHESNIHRSF